MNEKLSAVAPNSVVGSFLKNINTFSSEAEVINKFNIILEKLESIEKEMKLNKLERKFIPQEFWK